MSIGQSYQYDPTLSTSVQRTYDGYGAIATGSRFISNGTLKRAPGSKVMTVRTAQFNSRDFRISTMMGLLSPTLIAPTVFSPKRTSTEVITSTLMAPTACSPSAARRRTLRISSAGMAWDVSSTKRRVSPERPILDETISSWRGDSTQERILRQPWHPWNESRSYAYVTTRPVGVAICSVNLIRQASVAVQR